MLKMGCEFWGIFSSFRLSFGTALACCLPRRAMDALCFEELLVVHPMFMFGAPSKAMGFLLRIGTRQFTAYS